MPACSGHNTANHRRISPHGNPETKIQLGRGPGGRFALGNPIGFSERTVGLPRGERHGLEQKEGLLQIIEIGRHGRHLRLGQPVRNRLHDS